jgi:hypothetical protein
MKGKNTILISNRGSKNPYPTLVRTVPSLPYFYLQHTYSIVWYTMLFLSLLHIGFYD